MGAPVGFIHFDLRMASVANVVGNHVGGEQRTFEIMQKSGEAKDHRSSKKTDPMADWLKRRNRLNLLVLLRKRCEHYHGLEPPSMEKPGFL